MYLRIAFTISSYSSIVLTVSGTWRSFNEIYKTDLDTYTNPAMLSGIGHSVFEKEKLHIESQNRKFYRSRKGKEQNIADFKSSFTWPL